MPAVGRLRGRNHDPPVQRSRAAKSGSCHSVFDPGRVGLTNPHSRMTWTLATSTGATDQTLVELFDPSHYRRCGERPCTVERSPPHRRRGIAVVHHGRERSGEGDGVATSHQETGHAVVHEVNDPSTGGRHDRSTDGHCLEDHGRAAVGHDRGDDDHGRLQEVDGSV